MARSFRSASSRCASVDFTAFTAAVFAAFPFPAFGAMAEVVGENDGVGGDGGDGGRSAALFRLWKRRGAAEISEIGTANGEGGGTADRKSVV